MERKDRLFRVAHDHNVIFAVPAFWQFIQENRLENIPLQLVRILKFINNRIAVSFTKLFDKPAIPVHDRIMNRIDHVAKGLRLALTFFILPQIHQFFNMVEDKLLERLNGFLLQILVFKFKEKVNRIVQFIGIPNASPFFRKRTRKNLVRTVERFDSLDKIRNFQLIRFRLEFFFVNLVLILQQDIPRFACPGNPIQKAFQSSKIWRIAFYIAVQQKMIRGIHKILDEQIHLQIRRIQQIFEVRLKRPLVTNKPLDQIFYTVVRNHIQVKRRTRFVSKIVQHFLTE